MTLESFNFTHVGSPSRPIAGIVRDHETGQPLAGVTISAQMKGSPGGGRGKTDESGRYEVQGLPTSGIVSLYAICPDGMPYLNSKRGRIEFSAAAPLTDTDFELVRGVMIRGRLLAASQERHSFPWPADHRFFCPKHLRPLTTTLVRDAF